MKPAHNVRGGKKISLCLFVSTAFQLFLGKKDVSAELEEVYGEIRVQNTQQSVSFFRLFRNPSIRWQLISVISIMSSYQLCGLNVVSAILLHSHHL